MPDDLTARCREVLVRKAWMDRGDMVVPLDDAAAAMARELGPVLRFAALVIECSRDGGDAEGSDIQDWAVAAGLVAPTSVTESCGEGCRCEEWGDFPMECYRDSPLLAAAREGGR